VSPTSLDPDLKKLMLSWQKTEITEHYIYSNLAKVVKDPHNRQVIEQIAASEAEHAATFKSYTGKEISPNRWQIFIYYWIARLFGLTFGVKLMERGEEGAQAAYAGVSQRIPDVERILEEEEEHEEQLLAMLDEEALRYAGSVVLGLNDALVELTGALAGLTFAFQNTNLIAFTGLITGISAAFSMAASEYLSARADEQETNPLKAAVYTGIAYIFTVSILVLPYFILKNYIFCLAWTLTNAILVIAAFNFYIAVVKGLNFAKRFLEMALISLGVATFSFGVGVLIRKFFGLEV
jgi:VIT1/CCC1 family predicted Fe2+/Mn2+ transporter